MRINHDTIAQRFNSQRTFIQAMDMNECRGIIVNVALDQTHYHRNDDHHHYGHMNCRGDRAQN